LPYKSKKKQNEHSHDYYLAHRNEIIKQQVAYKRKWRTDNKEEFRRRNRKYCRDYYHNHRDRLHRIINERERLKRRKYPVYSRNQHLQARYGITQEEYQKEYDRRQGRCDICGKFCLKLFIDHDHKEEERSGRIIIRGLLCIKCNAATGMLDDDPILAEKAAQYLKNQRVVVVEQV
jgi:hypothetical protein